MERRAALATCRTESKSCIARLVLRVIWGEVASFHKGEVEVQEATIPLAMATLDT